MDDRTTGLCRTFSQLPQCSWHLPQCSWHPTWMWLGCFKPIINTVLGVKTKQLCRLLCMDLMLIVAWCRHKKLNAVSYLHVCLFPAHSPAQLAAGALCTFATITINF